MNTVYADKNDYAVSTFLFEEEPLNMALEAIAKHGFSTVELWGDTVHLDPRSKPNLIQIRTKLSELKLAVHSIHTPFRNFSAFTEQKEGEKWRKLLWKQSLDIASDLEIPVAVIHALNRSEYNYTYQSINYIHNLLGELVEYAKIRGVSLALENIPSGESNSEEILCTIVEQARLFGDIPHLKWCLDIGHVTITSNDMQNEIDATGSDLVSLHIHNNNGLSDLHNLPNDGVIDWPYWYDYLRKKGYQGQFVFEVCSGDNPIERLQALSALFDTGEFL